MDLTRSCGAADSLAKFRSALGIVALTGNLNYIRMACAESAELACDGERLERPTVGDYMSPSVLLNTRNEMRVNKQEMFAPIACIIKYDSYEETLRVANDTPFRLTAGVVTRSLARASHFRRNSKSGCVMVNLPTASTDSTFRS